MSSIKQYRFVSSAFVFLAVFQFLALLIAAQPAPKAVLGFTPGDDYKLAHWSKIVEYFKQLDAASDRVIFKEIGKTTMGKPFTYALISSPKNLKQLEYYKGINDKLADPRLIKRSQKEAAKLVKKGKTFVLITHGIHSTEVGSTLSSTLIAHKLATSKDKRITRILDNTIIVMVPSLNPDGVDIVKDWYDKTLGTKFEGTSPPTLYHKYVGHDNNRDWYAFTQVETQMTVEKIHNVYHPQIVHDIHQQGSNGARYFVPPYLDPVEPNVPKEIIEGYTEIGNYIAGAMRKDGKKGITTASTYDAWTPARAYSHYHGGARILSETASARLASPITIDPAKMTSRRGFDVTKESATYGPLWNGGKWGLSDITAYMTDGAFHLLDHASNNRKKWLERFHKIGFDATRPRKDGELWGYRLRIEDNYPRLSRILAMGGVQIGHPKGEKTTKVNNVSYFDTTTEYPSETVLIPMAQPYGSFAKVMLERQEYPNLKDAAGAPIPPYDVTAHNLALLNDISVTEVWGDYKPNWISKATVFVGISDCQLGQNKIAIFKSSIPSMDLGWTNWVFDKGPCIENEFLLESEIRAGNFGQKEPPSLSLPRRLQGASPEPYPIILFPDQSPNQILNGYPKDRMPKEFVGGIGAEGVAKLRTYVEDGGTLVFMNRSSDFAIEQFKLPVANIAKDWKRKDFFIPGSILRTELDTTHAIAKDMKKDSIAWFERSPVFELRGGSNENLFARVIAKYPDDPKDILLSGWALGKEKIAGKAALVEVRMGRGKIVLFGFRPQYRGQSVATFPLLFNSISY